MTADKQAQQKWFDELESNGTDVLILDRYTTSQSIYSEASGIELGWTKQLQQYLRKPDYEILIDIPEDESIKRKGKFKEGNDKYESNKKLLSDVRNKYLSYFNIHKDNMLIVDGLNDRDEIHKQIVEFCLEKLNRKEAY